MQSSQTNKYKTPKKQKNKGLGFDEYGSGNNRQIVTDIKEKKIRHNRELRKSQSERKDLSKSALQDRKKSSKVLTAMEKGRKSAKKFLKKFSQKSMGKIIFNKAASKKLFDKKLITVENFNIRDLINECNNDKEMKQTYQTMWAIFNNYEKVKVISKWQNFNVLLRNITMSRNSKILDIIFKGLQVEDIDNIRFNISSGKDGIFNLIYNKGQDIMELSQINTVAGDKGPNSGALVKKFKEIKLQSEAVKSRWKVDNIETYSFSSEREIGLLKKRTVNQLGKDGESDKNDRINQESVSSKKNSDLMFDDKGSRRRNHEFVNSEVRGSYKGESVMKLPFSGSDNFNLDSSVKLSSQDDSKVDSSPNSNKSTMGIDKWIQTEHMDNNSLEEHQSFVQLDRQSLLCAVPNNHREGSVGATDSQNDRCREKSNKRELKIQNLIKTPMVLYKEGSILTKSYEVDNVKIVGSYYCKLQSIEMFLGAMKTVISFEYEGNLITKALLEKAFRAESLKVKQEFICGKDPERGSMTCLKLYNTQMFELQDGHTVENGWNRLSKQDVRTVDSEEEVRMLLRHPEDGVNTVDVMQVGVYIGENRELQDFVSCDFMMNVDRSIILHGDFDIPRGEGYIMHGDNEECSQYNKYIKSENNEGDDQYMHGGVNGDSDDLF
ncbi:MAG: hypothetical protein AAFO15_01885 [Pseudomonadota bacterium]